MKLHAVMVAVGVMVSMMACTKDGSWPDSKPPNAAAPSEAQAIAEEAYIYAYPMLENYRTMYVQAIDRTAPGYAAPFNEITHKTELLGPEFKDIVRPNNDTMYSMVWLDLRAQPVVITVPAIEGRYFSVQLVDLFTHNFAYMEPEQPGASPEATSSRGRIGRAPCRVIRRPCSAARAISSTASFESKCAARAMLRRSTKSKTASG